MNVDTHTPFVSPESERFPVPLIRVAETDSTNSYLQTYCSGQRQVEELTVVITDFQTSGRGQRGNSWESAPDKNLLFSTVLFPHFLEARCQFLISQIVSLAIKDTLDEYITDVSIKWPNDIYWREKKICGILIENDLMGRHISRSIAGVGLNINQEEFLSSAPNPVSLRQITGEEHNRLEILELIMTRLRHYYDLLRKNDLSSITGPYEKALFRRKGMHRYQDANGTFSACIVRVEPEGRLILADTEGTERGYMFKEVEYVL